MFVFGYVVSLIEYMLIIQGNIYVTKKVISPSQPGAAIGKILGGGLDRFFTLHCTMNVKIRGVDQIFKVL